MQKLNLCQQVTAPLFYQAGRLPLASEFKTECAPSFEGWRLLKAKLEAVLTAQNDNNKVIMAHTFEPNYLSI